MKRWLADLGLAGRMTLRDWRSGELRLLMLSLIVAVAAMTSVGFFVDRLRSGMERDAAQLLGGDLILNADQPIADAVREEARVRGLRVADNVMFPSMALAGEAAQLASVKAVTANYPLRGKLRVADAPGAPDVQADEVPARGVVWVDAALLSALQLGMGDMVRLGERDFRIARVIVIEPDRGVSFASIAPRVMLNMDDLASTALLQVGSRETWRLQVAGEPQAVRGFQSWLEERLERGQRLETLEEGRPQMRQTLDRAEQFLSLVALLTAMLAAVAVALAARRYTRRHLDSCAVLRCMGMTQPALLRMYWWEFVFIGLIGATIGVALGFAAHFVFVQLLGTLIETGMPAPSPQPALQGFLVGFVLLIGFAMPPVIQLRHVPPLRVLRREIGMPRMPATLGYLLGMGAFAALLLWSARDLKVGLLTAGGFAAAFAVFALVAWLALRLLVLLRGASHLPSSWRFVLAAMERRPAATVVQTVALSIGLMALLLLSVTRGDLVDAWRRASPPDAPNRFIINIQPDQRAAFSAMVHDAGIRDFDFAPMVRGRLIEVNGRPVDPNTYKGEEAKRMVDREFNLSYMSELPEHNHVIDGAWNGAVADELSIEEGIAATLGLKMGDRLVFDIAGLPVAARITSVRKLDWDSMRINFFVIFPPAAMADMPQTWLAAYHLPDSKADLDNRLAQAFPNLSVINSGVILRQIQSVLDQVVRAVEFLFVFTLLAGLLVLYAALLSSRDERTREAALLRALGASRRQLSRAQMAEFIAVGILSGVLAAAGAVAVGWVLATQAFDFPYRSAFEPWLWGMLGGAAIAALGGWLGLRPVLNQPPLATLRDA